MQHLRKGLRKAALKDLGELGGFFDKFLGHSRTLASLPFLSSNGHEGDDADDADDDGSSDGDEEGILGAAANEDELLLSVIESDLLLLDRIMPSLLGFSIFFAVPAHVQLVVVVRAAQNVVR